MRPSSRRRQQARRHLEATVAAIRAELVLGADAWIGYRALEQLLEAAQEHLDATAPRPRGRQIAIAWCAACDGPAPGLGCQVCDATAGA
jgi:hypothetical protein